MAVLAAVAIATIAVRAITDGELDGNRHPTSD
jgi:hypothetical protein